MCLFRWAPEEISEPFSIRIVNKHINRNVSQEKIKGSDRLFYVKWNNAEFKVVKLIIIFDIFILLKNKLKTIIVVV